MTDIAPRQTNEPATLRWQALDAAHHLHPQTDSAALAKKGARVIVRGEGVYVWDSEGRRLIDGMSGLWCVALGYGRRELIEAGGRALRDLPFYNTFFQTTHPYAAELSAKLAEIAPAGLSRVMFHTSGSEATDAAAKLARYYWRLQGKPGREIILSRELGYHGSTMASASMTGIPYMREQFGLPLPGFETAPCPYQFRDGKGEDPEAFGRRIAAATERRILEIGPERIAAFIAEPVQGAGGLIVPPPGYWPAMGEILDRHGILFIADEVVTGFGRTGEWFGSETYGLRPDMMTLAKGLTSGYVPLAALMVGPRVAEPILAAGKDLAHGMTYEGHPVASAIALACLDVLTKERLPERVKTEIGPYFQARIATLADHPLVGEVRGVGLLAAMELTADKTTGERFPNEGKTGLLARDFCFDNGLVMRSIRDTMVLAPPLVITKTEVDELIAQARVCLDLTFSAVRKSTKV
ncbi:MAG: aminotransferase [Alphaproteobacteria bacterium]